jgi:hypothetical protein
MNWYGSLIEKDKEQTFVDIDNRWKKYRSHYPENIKQIRITATDLTPLTDDKQYQFIVKTLISYTNTDGNTQSQELSETFIFSVPFLSLPLIQHVSIDKTESTTTFETTKYNRSHYKIREFSYSWLAYLDGAELAPALYASQWIDKANYTIKIGTKTIQGSVLSALEQRKQYLAKGGHLLRSVDVKKQEGQDTYLLIITAQWKGVNQDGKPVIAKVRQTIKYKVLADHSWQILTIDEQHLLPDIAPWIGLLC